jgi:hypothetical protein
VGDAASLIDPDQVFFEVTKQHKVGRIAAIGCDIFIDDLPEILALPGFSDSTRRILFDPANQFSAAALRIGNVDRFLSWDAIATELHCDLLRRAG